jgi:uncharacterized heparinase superfamily protein
MHAALHPIYVSPLYRRILGQVAGGELRCRPHDPWPGDPVRAQALLSGRYPFAGQVLDAAAPPEGETAAPPWHPPEATRPWHAELHGFAWLRDLRAHNTDDARRLARELVDDWMRGHPGPGRQAWAPAVMGARLTYWLGQHGFFADSAEAGFRIRLTESMTRQARHLQWVLPAGLTGAPLLTAIKGLLYAGLCLPDGDRFRRRALALLERALPQQIHVDGGHVSRSPATHLRVLCDLLDIRATFAAAGLDAPRSVVLAIESMTPILKLLRQGDGGLALFNGADEGARDVIDLAVKRAGLRGKPHQAAPQTGFQRVEAARTLLLVDAGAPPEPGADDAAHAGTLSFELSEGRRRIITNCGAPPRGTSWVQAARTTAAHSTVVVDETNSSELLPLDGLGGGGLGRRPHNVSCRREEAAGAILLDMSHDGYARSHDARHTRRLYLDSGGGDLRGEDVVTGPEGLSVAVRFHLHPEVRAGLVQNGTAVLVRVPNGAGWRLQASGASLSLEESVYFGRADTVRRTQQIVLATRTGAHRTVVKWALKREGEA